MAKRDSEFKNYCSIGHDRLHFDGMRCPRCDSIMLARAVEDRRVKLTALRAVELEYSQACSSVHALEDAVEAHNMEQG